MRTIPPLPASSVPGLLELWQPLRGVWFCLGVLSGWAWIALPAGIGAAVAVGSVLCGLLAAGSWSSRAAVLAGLALQAGLGLGWNRAIFREPAQAEVSIVVEETFRTGAALGRIVRTDREDWQGARVRLRAERAGDTLQGKARLLPPRKATVPGAFDERAWMATEGWDGRAVWTDSVSVAGSARREEGELERRVRRFVRQGLSRRLEPSSSALWTATLLAENDRVPPQALDAFRQSGLFHMLSVSGFHMAVLGGGTLLLLGLFRLDRKWAWLGAALVVVAYAWLLGGSAPIVRSTIAFVVASIAWISGRPLHAGNAFFLALGGLVAADPNLPFQLGAQLTFAATGALLWLAPVLERWTIPVRLRESLPGRWILRPLVVSVAATLATAPLLAWNTGMVPWVGVPAGVAAGVVFSVGFLAALATAALSFLPSWVTLGFAGAADGAARLIWEITLRSGDWKSGTFLVGRPDALTLALVLATVASIFWIERRVFRWKVVAALLCAWGVWAFRGDHRERRTLEVVFLDVGQGSATLVKWPSGRIWLVDAGPASWKDPRRNAGADRILPYLRSKGIDRLDAVVVSHADLDHWGGLQGLASSLEPTRLLLSVDSGTPGSPAFDSLVGDLVGRGWRPERIGQGQKMTYGDGAHCEVLGPGLSGPLPRNRTSLVLRWVFDSSSVVVAGDADSVEEAEILRSGLAEDAGTDILTAGHHGSRHSTHARWLQALEPRWTVLAYGETNRYGHPHREVLDRLLVAGSEPVHLPRGTAAFVLDGHGARRIQENPDVFWRGPWRWEVSLSRPWTWIPRFGKSSTRPPSSDDPSTGS